MSHRILVCDDEPDITALVAYHLAKAGYRVSTAASGPEALRAAREERPDVVVLDLMLPGVSGYDILKELRAKDDTREIGVILLTARREEPDRIKGLTLGADDYLTKPFSPRELMARVAAVMRRIRPALAGETVEVGDIVLDPVAHRVTRRGTTLQLGPTEYRLLKFFMESPGRVFSRSQLLDGVWGTGSEIELRTVDVHIRRLRMALAMQGSKDPVRTVRSAGYSFES